jgi:hypothetical protein
LRDIGGVDRKRATEMQTDFQFAIGLFLDLLDDGVHALDGATGL